MNLEFMIKKGEQLGKSKNFSFGNYGMNLEFLIEKGI